MKLKQPREEVNEVKELKEVHCVLCNCSSRRFAPGVSLETLSFHRQKCGNEVEMHVYGAQRSKMPLSPWDVYLDWRRSHGRRTQLRVEVVSRQLREEKVRQIWKPEAGKWLDVSTPLSVDLVIDGVHFRTHFSRSNPKPVEGKNLY